ncbi:MAG: hypothetical protein QM790_01535 [Nibricoccus sp.]
MKILIRSFLVLLALSATALFSQAAVEATPVAAQHHHKTAKILKKTAKKHKKHKKHKNL